MAQYECVVRVSHIVTYDDVQRKIIRSEFFSGKPEVYDFDKAWISRIDEASQRPRPVTDEEQARIRAELVETLERPDFFPPTPTIHWRAG